jgi:hypothetical protein
MCSIFIPPSTGLSAGGRVAKLLREDGKELPQRQFIVTQDAPRELDLPRIENTLARSELFLEIS